MVAASQLCEGGVLGTEILFLRGNLTESYFQVQQMTIINNKTWFKFVISLYWT